MKINGVNLFSLSKRIHRGIVVALLVIMAAELIFLLIEQQWLTAFMVIMIIGVTLLPLIFKKMQLVDIPAEFHLLTVIFIFASLFLGEIQGFYERVWWWDINLHAVSGLLMGIFGFLLVYILNESSHIELYMRPRFVALFAFVFAVAIGTIWEIFEFGMDLIFGMNMQKEMFGDVSGLTDTMWDMIVNLIGALTISVLGGLYMKRKESFFIETWIRKFIAKNPRMFRS